jgi:hypothetical protein
LQNAQKVHKNMAYIEIEYSIPSYSFKLNWVVAASSDIFFRQALFDFSEKPSIRLEINVMSHYGILYVTNNIYTIYYLDFEALTDIKLWHWKTFLSVE